MAKKPLKLKRYVTEDEAAQLLSALIDEDVTPEEMHEFARSGVVPAYLKFLPQDRIRHPGDCFGLVNAEYFLPVVRNHFRGVFDETTNSTDRELIQELGVHDLEPCFQPLPYPLLGGSYISAANGRWRVLVERENGSVEPVTAEHYVRMYSPSEICRAAQLMNDPCSCPEWPAILHAHATVYEDEFDEYDPFELDSPFDQQLHFSIPSQAQAVSEPSPNLEMSDRPTPKSYRLIIAGMIELLTEANGCTQDDIAESIKERHPSWRTSPSLINKVFAEVNRVADAEGR